MLELENKTLQKIFNFGLILVACILLVSFMNSDLIITTRHGIHFWNILFNGRILHFYEDVNVPTGYFYHTTEPVTAIYNFLVYIVFAVWNFPMWFLEKIAAVDVMNNFFCLVYMKILPLLAILFCAKIIGKILKEIGCSQERIKLTQYLYLSSTVILANVLIASRYDGLCSVFMLLSLLYYLRKDFRKFLFYAGISFCFNYISFAMFLPLLLLREKNLRKIITNLLLLVLPYILTTVPFSIGKTALSVGGSFTINNLSMLFSMTNGLFSWFTVFYAIVVVYSFLIDKENSENKDFIFWISFASMASFFAFLYIKPYWSILCVPFVCLLIGNSNPRKDVITILLEAIAMFGMTVDKMFRYIACYMGNTLNSMLMSFIFPDRVYKNDEVWGAVETLKETTAIAKGGVPDQDPSLSFNHFLWQVS